MVVNALFTSVSICPMDSYTSPSNEPKPITISLLGANPLSTPNECAHKSAGEAVRLANPTGIRLRQPRLMGCAVTFITLGRGFARRTPARPLATERLSGIINGCHSLRPITNA